MNHLFSCRLNLRHFIFAALIGVGLAAGAKELDLDDPPPVSAKKKVEVAPVPTVAVEKVSPDLQKKIQAAEALEKKSDLDGVIALLKPSTDVLPRSGLLLLARAYRVKDHALEVRTLELCLAKSPKDYVVKTALGLAQARTTRNDDAVATLREARSWNSKYPPTYDALAKVLEDVGDRYEARETVTDKIQMFGVPNDYSNLCRLYSLDDFLEKSVEVCNAAIEKDPGNPENYIHLGASLRDLEKSDQAIVVLEKAAKRFPASVSVHSAAGKMKASGKDFVGAYKYFKQAVQADPKSGSAQLGLANAAFELQKNQEALDAFATACRLDRQHAKTDFSVATAKLRNRKDTVWENRFDSKLGECESP